jgi:hypothetical protein
VVYDFRTEGARYDGDMPLILAQIEQDLRSGTALVRYSIPAPVRAAILEAAEYAMLELNVFPRFSSRYSGRLYPRLAWRAAQPGRTGERWEVEPVALAESLGYPVDGSLHFASFMKRCVEPAVSDINEHVAAFSVKLGDPVRGEGRGRPVERLVFEMAVAAKRFEAVQAAWLTQREYDVISRPDEVLAHDELPSTLLVGKAVTLTGLPAVDLSEGWRRVLAKAKALPNDECLPGIQGGMLAFTVRKDGLASGFAMYAESVAASGSIPSGRVAASAPAVVVVPETEPSPQPFADAGDTRHRETASKAADDLLDALAGYMPSTGRHFRTRFEDFHFNAWCDPETLPWCVMEKHMEGFEVLSKALVAMAETGGERRRKSLSNLAYAVKDWNLDKVEEISGKILVAIEDGRFAAPIPPKPSKFKPTKEITEACAEYRIRFCRPRLCRRRHSVGQP